MLNGVPPKPSTPDTLNESNNTYGSPRTLRGTDITYIRTWKGWLHRAVVRDLVIAGTTACDLESFFASLKERTRHVANVSYDRRKLVAEKCLQNRGSSTLSVIFRSQYSIRSMFSSREPVHVGHHTLGLPELETFTFRSQIYIIDDIREVIERLLVFKRTGNGLRSVSGEIRSSSVDSCMHLARIAETEDYITGNPD